MFSWFHVWTKADWGAECGMSMCYSLVWPSSCERNLKVANGLTCSVWSMDHLSCLRFHQMFSPQFAVSQKRSVRCHQQWCHHSVHFQWCFKKSGNQKGQRRNGVKRFRTRSSAYRWILFPFCYMNIYVLHLSFLCYMSSLCCFPFVVSGPWWTLRQWSLKEW